MKLQDIIFHSKPKHYGIAYLALIPIFSLLYYFVPDVIGEQNSFIKCLYFSAVTITTLGYGDIIPASDWGLFMAASEAVLGVTLVGLFLNALSTTRSELNQAEQEEKEKDAYRGAEVAKLLGRYNLLQPLIAEHRLCVNEVTNPLENGSNNRKYDPNFQVSDLRDIYSPSMRLAKVSNKSVIEHYFSSLEKLTSELSGVVKNVDLRLFSSLEENCLEFIRSYHLFDFSEAMIGAKNAKNMIEMTRKWIEEWEGEPEFRQSNSLNSYMALFHQIKRHMELLDKIEAEMVQLK